MSAILYSAVDSQNNETYGYCNGNSNTEVLEKLKKEGLSNIQLYYDVLTASERDDLNLLDKKALEKIAKHDIEMLLNPSFFKYTLFSLKNRQNLLILFLGFFVVIMGMIFNNIWLTGIGLVICLVVLILAMVGYVLIYNFKRIYDAIAYGYWDKAEKALNGFHNYDEKIFPKDVKVALAKIRGLLLAIKNSPDVALQKVEEIYGFLKDIAPLNYMLLIADIHYINGEYEEFLKQISKIYQQYPDDAVVTLDLAKAEVLFGDKYKAETLLNQIKKEELPITFLPMIDFIRGLLIQESDSDKTLEYLQNSLMNLEKFKNVAGFLETIALVAGYYSIVLYDNQYEEKAKNILESYWNILKIHGNENLLEDIYTRMPYFKKVS